ncbi:MAG: hypothetical protein KA715_00900 [Xanthomonadaceae bacterium]|nr:hypothetical protein [Xanthomonadaceae bacterium]
MNQLISILCIGTLILVAELGIAAGKAPSKSSVDRSEALNGSQSGLVANPIRKVVVHSVGTKPFDLPNGSSMDLTADLDTMFVTSLTNNSRLAPSLGSPETSCDSHVEVRAAITTLELNIAELGIKVGYSPKGSISQSANVGGEVKVKGGTIAMDFSVWQCDQGHCYAVAASTVNHTVLGTELSFGINLGQIKIGPNLIYNTALGGMIRKMMDKGVAGLAASPRTSVLAWQATVVSVSHSDGSAIIDVGARELIEPNQDLVVYTPVSSGGSCRVYQSVAYIRTVQVDTVSSIAQVEQVLSPRAIEVGDVVMVKPPKTR